MSTMTRSALLSMIMLAACSPSTGTAQSPKSKPFTETIIADFDAPWAIAALPDGRMLVTEKTGALKLVSSDGKTIEIVEGTPMVDSAGQGGLHDVVLHPDFAKNGLVYLSWSESGPGGKGIALGRGRLVNSVIQCLSAPCPVKPGLVGFQTLFRASPFVEGNGHYSGRIAFSPDGNYLFFTNGERQKFTPAQDKMATLGKVLRLTPDGKAAPGNPLTTQGFAPEIWSYGHRNLLGIAFDAKGNLWEQEMGPQAGDELNLILPGKNYGYPKASNGRNYGAATDDIPDHKPGDGFEAPKVFWGEGQTISPGGLMIYSGKLFPQWRGDAFIGGLSSQALIRVDLNGVRATKGDQWPMGARIRDVEEGPDGAIYIIEDGARGSQGRMIKLMPVKE